MTVREYSFADFEKLDRAQARAGNFNVDWVRVRAGEAYEFQGDEEQMLLLPISSATVSVLGDTQAVGARTVTILPAGTTQVTSSEDGIAVHLSTSPSSRALNAADYAISDPRIAPVGAPKQRKNGLGRLHVIDVDAIVPPPDKPRLKMIQSSVMSINWVEYDGPRDRTALSPHNHADLEQGSLAIYGDFVHHLRVPWSQNANDWREDIHLEAGAQTLTVIPVEMIHTTEGVGPGKHLLIDIFAPARADFIAKGWMSNGNDYS